MDTNVLVSALTTRGFCWDLLELTSIEPELLISEAVLSQFVRVLTVKFRVPPETVMAAVEYLRTITVLAPESQTVSAGIPDPDDAPILASAASAGADLFITGDKALLDLRHMEHMTILPPRSAWQRLTREPQKPSGFDPTSGPAAP